MKPSLTHLVGPLAAALTLGVAGTGLGASSIVTEPFGPGWTPGTTWSTAGTYTPRVVTDNAQTPATALRLTPAVNSQSGSVSYTTPQPASGGLDVSFVASQWGGNGADGIVFFLREGSDPSNAPGAVGGSMGYSTNRQQGLSGPGMPGGVVGVGLDLYGNYAANSIFGGADCVDGTGNSNIPNSIAIRGAGDGYTGYCRLGIVSGGSIAFDGGTDTRNGRARSFRVTVDPFTQVNPRVKVFYGPDASGTNLTQVLDVAAPADLTDESTFKFGFSAGTGGLNNNSDVWGLEVESLVDLPPVAITTTSLPAGTVGTAYACTTIATADGVAPVTLAIADGSLPPGLTFDPATAQVCGTPTTEGASTFTVRATDSRGPTPSTTTRAYTIPVADSGPPCVPVDLSAMPGLRKASLSWKPNPDAACPGTKRYEVQASTGETCTTTAPAVTCSITGLKPGEPVRFRVRALNDVGASEWSAYSEAISPEHDPVPAVETARTSVASDAIIVVVSSTRAGQALVVGQSRTNGRWVTRCVGTAAISRATEARRVRCVLTPIAKRLLCTKPLTLRVVTRLTTQGMPPELSRKTVRAAKRSCDTPAVAG